MSDEIDTAEEIGQAFLHKTIVTVVPHLDEDGGVDWLGLTFGDGTEVEVTAHGMHTEGWLVIERGRRIRDIYGISDETETP